MPTSPISHVSGLFDIVGKTVDDVLYSPAQHGTGEFAQLVFTDGTTLDITVTERFDEMVLHAQQEL